MPNERITVKRTSLHLEDSPGLSEHRGLGRLTARGISSTGVDLAQWWRVHGELQVSSGLERKFLANSKASGKHVKNLDYIRVNPEP